MTELSELYRVVYLDRDGREVAAPAELLRDAEVRARSLDADGFSVGSVMPAENVEAYFNRRGEPLKRSVRGSMQEYSVMHGRRRYRFKKSWHFLDNGERYYYIHVYREIERLPFKRFAWVTEVDGSNPRWL